VEEVASHPSNMSSGSEASGSDGARETEVVRTAREFEQMGRSSRGRPDIWALVLPSKQAYKTCLNINRMLLEFSMFSRCFFYFSRDNSNF
jgi:hypothetical protein